MTNDNFFAPQRRSETTAIAKVDPSAMAAAEAAKAQIQAAYIMAFQKPRQEMDARDRILTACKRTEFAEKAEYSKPVGDKKIKGPSIRFAELALREWGNIRTESTVMYEDDDIRRIRVSCLDLETNAQFLKDIQIKKTIERKSKKGREDDVLGERKNTYGEIVYILRATDEEMMTKEAAWVSKVIRNEGLRLIPTDIIEEGMNLCHQTLTDKAKKDPAGEKKKIMDSFSSIGVKPKELEKYLKHSLDIIVPAEINDLRAIFSAIRDGEAKWVDYVNQKVDNAADEINDAINGKVEEKPAEAFDQGYREQALKAVETMSVDELTKEINSIGEEKLMDALQRCEMSNIPSTKSGMLKLLKEYYGK